MFTLIRNCINAVVSMFANSKTRGAAVSSITAIVMVITAIIAGALWLFYAGAVLTFINLFITHYSLKQDGDHKDNQNLARLYFLSLLVLTAAIVPAMVLIITSFAGSAV